MKIAETCPACTAERLSWLGERHLCSLSPKGLEYYVLSFMGKAPHSIDDL